jgi:hypothetical protein
VERVEKTNDVYEVSPLKQKVEEKREEENKYELKIREI